MTTLAIDIETYSETDLIKSGVYKYVEDPSFTILLFAYSYNKGPVHIIDLASGETIPEDLQEDLYAIDVIKTAYNANFERTCISAFLKMYVPSLGWQCTMAKASMLSLPLSLDACAKALNLSVEKDAAGKALIKYFSLPCKPTKANGGRTRNLPVHDPEKWERFKNYCIQDVVVEKEIREKISYFQIPKQEEDLWRLDQLINDTGVLVDPVFIKNAISINTEYVGKLNKEALELTGLENPNSPAQLKQWLSDETDSEVDSLTKTAIPELLESTDCDTVKRVLNIRQEMAKTSVKKYQAMVNAKCKDNRIRGLLQYYGANRTGRWAGRLVQVQNLPQNHLDALDMARELVRDGDGEMLDILFGNIPDTLSQLIRTAFIAPPDHRFIVADFSAIEARVIAWLAGEKWRIDVFNTHGKIYEASASQMFKVPIESVTKGSDLRQKGKVSELALGYQGGPNALISMGALRMGLQEEELPKLVAMWRQANRAITKFWDDVNDAAMEAVQEPGTIHKLKHGISFFMERGNLFIQLPSGRKLCYLSARFKPNRFGGQAIAYLGMNQTTKQWGWQETYGGKLVENIVQAVARDCLATAMLRLFNEGYNIAFHVHDEVVLEMPYGEGSTGAVNKIMGTPIEWANGLPLKADSYETEYYKKD